MPPREPLDVLEMREGYEAAANGAFDFSGTLVVYRADDGLHHAVSKSRYSSPSEVHLDHLSNDILIPVAAYSPLFPPNFTRAPDPLPQHCYVKKPQL